MAVWLEVKVRGCGLSLWPLDCTPDWSVTKAPMQLQLQLVVALC